MAVDSVQRGVERHRREQGEAPPLRFNTAAHSPSGSSREHLVAARRLDDPGVLLELALELARAPSRRGRRRRARGARRRRRASVSSRSPGTKPRSGSTSTMACAGSSHSASTMTPVGATGPPTQTRGAGSASQSRSGTASATGAGRRPVEHEPHRAVLGVLRDEDDGAPEVRVQEGRARDQELAAQRVHVRPAARSRAGSMPQRAASVGELRRQRPAVRARLALVVGRGALERHAAGVVADRPQLGDLLGRRARRRPAAAASSARLASIGRASGPGSWMSVGATQRTGAWARFHWQASWSSVSPWRSAIGRMRVELLAAGLDPARGPEARGGRSFGNGWPGSTSSWNSPP